jgi:hypothetical protein
MVPTERILELTTENLEIFRYSWRKLSGDSVTNGVLVSPLAETMPMNGCSRELERKVREKRWMMEGRMPTVTAQRGAPKTREFEMR